MWSAEEVEQKHACFVTTSSVPEKWGPRVKGQQRISMKGQADHQSKNATSGLLNHNDDELPGFARPRL